MTRKPRTEYRHAPNGLDVYLSTYRDAALLSADEERQLAEAIRRGDSEARARMIRSNLRLVVKIARDYLGRGLALDDLVGEGNLGLIRAAEEYDPSFGTRFSTYAAYWIRQAIRHALINTTATIRLPAHMVNLLTKWRRAERALGRELGFAPSFDRIADELDLSPARRRMVAQALDARRLCGEGADPDGVSWTSEEATDPHEAPEIALEAAEERHALLGRLDRLDDRERTIIALRYGLDGREPTSLKEIGRRLGVTREWVRRIEVRALQKLGNSDDPTSDGRHEPTPTRPRSARSSRRSPALALQAV